jgi:hypothetical protein
LSSCRQGEFFLLATEVTDRSAVHDELVNTKKLVKTTRTLTEENNYNTNTDTPNSSPQSTSAQEHQLKKKPKFF